MSSEDQFVTVHVEFTSVAALDHKERGYLSNSTSGGLELLFSNKREHAVSLPSTDIKGDATNMASLIRYLCENLMSDRRMEMFVIDGAV